MPPGVVLTLSDAGARGTISWQCLGRSEANFDAIDKSGMVTVAVNLSAVAYRNSPARTTATDAAGPTGPPCAAASWVSWHGWSATLARSAPGYPRNTTYQPRCWPGYDDYQSGLDQRPGQQTTGTCEPGAPNRDTAARPPPETTHTHTHIGAHLSTIIRPALSEDPGPKDSSDP
jgi:hypothetical protein